MATQALTSATFEATVTENPVVLVDFWAAWCGTVPLVRPNLRGGLGQA